LSAQLIYNTDYITALFNHLNIQKLVPICLKSENGLEFTSVMSITYKKDNRIEIEVQSPKYDLTESSFKCYILFNQSFEELFSFDIEVIESNDNIYKIAMPQHISIYLLRKFSRYDLDRNNNRAAYIYIPTVKKTFTIIDISSGGLSFKCERLILNNSETISDIEVAIVQDLEIRCDAQVKYIKKISRNKYIYGIQFINISSENINKLYLYIFKNCYYKLKLVNDFTDMQSNDAKALYPNQLGLSDLNSSMEEKSLISVFQLKNNVTINSLTAFKMFSHTFACPLKYQLFDIDLTPADKISILAGFTDALINNPQCQYYLLYSHLDSEYAHAILFAHRLMGSGSQFMIDKMSIFECSVDRTIDYMYDYSYTCEEVTHIEEFINYCSYNLSNLEIDCYDYNLAQLTATRGYVSAPRSFWKISDSEGQIVAYAVGCIGPVDTLDICTVYMISNHADIVQIIKSLIPVAAQHYSKCFKTCFYIHISYSSFENIGIKEIQIPEILGVKFKCIVLRAIMDHVGMVELKNIIAFAPLHALKYFPLTYPQKSICNVAKIYPNTSFGNTAVTVKIKAQIDFDVLEQAINTVIKTSDSIRLRLIELNSDLIQYINSYEYKSIEKIDFDNDINKLYKWDEQQTLSEFNVIDSDLFYFAMFKISEYENGFYVKLHHVVSDGWSTLLIIKRIIKLYYNLKNNKLIDMHLRPSYREYVLKESEYLTSKKFKENEEFWDSTFKTMPEPTQLKLYCASNISTTAVRKTFLIPESLYSKIHKFCSDNKCSPFALFLAIVSIYISKMTSKQDVVIGTLTLNRTDLKDKLTCGMFLNTLPIRLNVNGKVSFKEYLKIVSQQLISYFKHQRYPYELIQKRFREKHKCFHNLFDIVISYQDMSLDISDYSNEVNLKWHFNQNQTESLAVHVSDRDNQGAYAINLDYLVDKFSDDEITKISEHLPSLLEELIQNPLKEIHDIEIISDAEKNILLNVFNNTYMEYPKNKTINALIEEQAENTPENVAIVCDEKSLTYYELNCKANQLARTLRNMGVKPYSIVGIVVNRSIDMIIAILGVLKSGAAYVPIDPDYPKDRIEFMINDSNANIIITQTHISDIFEFNRRTLNLDDSSIYDKDSSNLEIVNANTNLAYAIYTSSSTGYPKGVMVEHRAVVNFIWGILDKIGNLKSETILSSTTISFDIFVLETLLPLVIGAKIVVANQMQQNDPRELNKLIQSFGVTLLQLTPSRLELFLKDFGCHEALKNVKKIILGGEQLPLELYIRLKNMCEAEIFNAYGPTETTVWSTIKKLSGYESKIITIGTPIANTRIYIVDDKLNIVPMGMAGELCIAGDSLARGYLNRADLTARSFAYLPKVKDEKIYKTGDIAKWLPSGEIEILGRMDNQVKIRGFRVELREIENLLQKYPYIDHAVVVLAQDLHENKYLDAYIVSYADINYSKLREYLSDKLPYYMMPSRFTRIEALPLTPNGKVNRRALVSMSQQQEYSSFEKVEPLS